jgi:hypothetical protein
MNFESHRKEDTEFSAMCAYPFRANRKETPPTAFYAMQYRGHTTILFSCISVCFFTMFSFSSTLAFFRQTYLHGSMDLQSSH